MAQILKVFCRRGSVHCNEAACFPLKLFTILPHSFLELNTVDDYYYIIEQLKRMCKRKSR